MGTCAFTESDGKKIMIFERKIVLENKLKIVFEPKRNNEEYYEIRSNKEHITPFND